MKNQPTHPCINCIYFKACGDTTCTMLCDGRMTKSEKKIENNINEIIAEAVKGRN